MKSLTFGMTLPNRLLLGSDWDALACLHRKMWHNRSPLENNWR
jgi:hypothetical protein